MIPDKKVMGVKPLGIKSVELPKKQIYFCILILQN